MLNPFKMLKDLKTKRLQKQLEKNNAKLEAELKEAKSSVVEIEFLDGTSKGLLVTPYIRYYNKKAQYISHAPHDVREIVTSTGDVTLRHSDTSSTFYSHKFVKRVTVTVQ